MEAKASSFLVYLFGAWLTSGRFSYSLLLASVATGLAFLDYGWSAIQWFGVALLIAGFLRVSGLLPL